MEYPSYFYYIHTDDEDRMLFYIETHIHSYLHKLYTSMHFYFIKYNKERRQNLLNFLFLYFWTKSHAISFTHVQKKT